MLVIQKLSIWILFAGNVGLVIYAMRAVKKS